MVRTALWRWYVQSSIKFAYIVRGIFSLIVMVSVWHECVSIVMVYVIVRILSAQRENLHSLNFSIHSREN